MYAGRRGHFADSGGWLHLNDDRAGRRVTGVLSREGHFHGIGAGLVRSTVGI